jgi:hypothetical protein
MKMVIEAMLKLDRRSSKLALYDSRQNKGNEMK